MKDCGDRRASRVSGDSASVRGVRAWVVGAAVVATLAGMTGGVGGGGLAWGQSTTQPAGGGAGGAGGAAVRNDERAAALLEGPATLPARTRVDAGLAGRNVDQIRISGNNTTSAAVILNSVRTREGEPLDPATVEEDYQRIFRLRRFSDVEARVEPTATGGVVVVFTVMEQRSVTSLSFLGNAAVPTPSIRDVVDVRVGESIDRFRIALAKQNIERLYKDKNFPFASVEVDEVKLASFGELIFTIVEGPNVRIRRVSFPGNQSFEKATLMRQIRSRSWIFVFRNGRLDFEQLEDDVGALRRFYEGKGFFDVRVGRRLRFSPDLSQVQVDFVIDEGKRYEINKISFEGNTKLDEAKLLEEFRLKVGDYYDRDIEQRDVRLVVKAYSPFGLIYLPQSNSPEYLRIDPQAVFQKEPGKVELVYRINEGKPFRMGRVLVKGNGQSMDKLVLREMRVQPGELYNSAELADAQERIRGTAYFREATITPVGDDPNYRDVLVEVQERQFRSFNVGAGVNSNGGVAGNLSFEHRNFDIGQVPSTLGDTFTDRAFTGAGQRFRISLEPGTEVQNASVLFSEPALWDSKYSFTNEYYIRNRIRQDWQETRTGGRVTLGRRLDFENAVSLTFRGEDVRIYDIDNKPLRAQEILDENGHNLVTSFTLGFTRDTTNRGLFPYKGYTFRAAVEQFTPPGEYTFTKVTTSYNHYFMLYEDLIERKTVLAINADSGNIFGDAPFFESFYAGGLSSLRGFSFRGVSPRSGLDDDAIGGDFLLLLSAEVSYPLAGEFLRGVVFVDTGTVESDIQLGQYRSAVGTGFRLYLPFFGQAPFALDFAAPLSKDSQDETQVVSFSFGFNP